ncbi:hypothetical protein phiAS5_ORF0308 [Aeromonas phage phiAS5]|uniref:Uncharacterized protein n=1 Tax=Aeromonas phage phiAS5 TaxID=879630 RepID=E1A262_9CAUD|nr:hypothetical protein phiAS5_ORF0308 [Aeromonas phage phiAS5]ADM80151.1 hypothetical protein phiAS5_ORF0308 [Aeromonas phage phiAS5]BES53088.1 hypothetical protein [Aeromonas phage phiWae14]
MIESVIVKMRKEAESLRNDTLVSMREGVTNDIVAKYLDKYADELERAVMNPIAL